MATKVKPCRIQATGTPQAWYVPKYVDEDTFQWWAWWGGWWSDIEYVTQAEYEALLPWAESDWKHYFIYTSSSSPRLPSAYQEVEYIQSSWTQYINTWWYPSSNYCKVIADWVFGFLDDWNVLFWMTNGSNGYSIQSHQNKYYINAWSTWNLNTQLTAGDWDDGIIEYEATNGTLNISVIWNIYTGSYSWSVAQSTRPMYIFKLNENGSATWGTPMKLREFKIYSGADTLARDFIPCYRIADSVIWLYDIVNDQFYTNAGTWSFTKWSDV